MYRISCQLPLRLTSGPVSKFTPRIGRLASLCATSQVTLRRLSEALRSIDLQQLQQSSQMETGLGLEALDGTSKESINSSLEVRLSFP